MCVIDTSKCSRSSLRRSWCMMLCRSSLVLACLLMRDANMWRNLETVSLFTYDGGSFFCAFSMALCTAMIVASGVSGNVLVLLHPGGASISNVLYCAGCVWVVIVAAVIFSYHHHPHHHHPLNEKGLCRHCNNGE